MQKRYNRKCQSGQNQHQLITVHHFDVIMKCHTLSSYLCTVTLAIGFMASNRFSLSEAVMLLDSSFGTSDTEVGELDDQPSTSTPSLAWVMQTGMNESPLESDLDLPSETEPTTSNGVRDELKASDTGSNDDAALSLPSNLTRSECSDPAEMGKSDSE